MIEPILLAAACVFTFDQGRRLTNASGFFFQRDERLFLVTSRHVFIDAPSKHFPDRIEIELHTDPDNLAESTGFSIPLYRDGQSIWRQGVDRAGEVDVAVIEIQRSALPVTTVYRAFTPQHLAGPHDRVEVGTSLLVVGFPLGFQDTLHHMPVVRHAVIASSFGLRFNGQAGFETQLPAHIELGPVTVNGFFISAKAVASPAKVVVATGAGFSLKLGPLLAVIDNVGLKLESQQRGPGEPAGTFGDLKLDFGFKPPSGIGLSIDGGGFKGGGFLDFEPEEERYSGMLELEFQDQFSLKAFGLLNTRLPNGQSGFSLLIVISSEFTPIQLGFGFKLNGVGGLLGLNRTVLTEPLRTGLRDNTLGSILFPTDIIANADRILSDLRQVFPPQSGRFVFGPMATGAQRVVKIGYRVE